MSVNQGAMANWSIVENLKFFGAWIGDVQVLGRGVRPHAYKRLIDSGGPIDRLEAHLTRQFQRSSPPSKPADSLIVMFDEVLHITLLETAP